jgi:hypothetical protein
MATRKKKIPDDCMPMCKTCSFYLTDPKDSAGFCRRYPAVVVVINDEVECGFPVMLPDEWCGEYARATN